MGKEIKMSGLAASILSSQLQQEVDDYCSLKLQSLYGAVPVSGSSDHDGRIASMANDFLASFARVVGSDVSTVQGMRVSFENADAYAAKGIAAR